MQPPKNWSAVAEKLEAHSDADVRDLASQLSRLFGDESAIKRALATITNKQIAANVRKKKLQALLGQQNVEASNLLEGLLDDPDLQMTAVRGYAAVENKKAPSIPLEAVLCDVTRTSPGCRRDAGHSKAVRRSNVGCCRSEENPSQRYS